jgi:hypothetical protein
MKQERLFFSWRPHDEGVAMGGGEEELPSLRFITRRLKTKVFEAFLPTLILTPLNMKYHWIFSHHSVHNGMR